MVFILDYMRGSLCSTHSKSVFDVHGQMEVLHCGYVS